MEQKIKNNGWYVAGTYAFIIFIFIFNNCNRNPPTPQPTFEKETAGYIDSICPGDSCLGIKYEPIVPTPRVNWKDSAINKLKISEGFRSRPYKGLGGKMLIGYGCSYPRLWESPLITERQAERILISKFDKYVRIAKRDGLRGNQAYAISDLIYNIGSTRYRNSTLRKLILADESDERICKELMKWTHANGVEYRGLVKRRKWECDMFMGISS